MQTYIVYLDRMSITVKKDVRSSMQLQAHVPHCDDDWSIATLQPLKCSSPTNEIGRLEELGICPVERVLLVLRCEN